MFKSIASKDLPDFICSYVDIKPGIIKTTKPKTNKYDEYEIIIGLYFVIKRARKKPTPVLQFAAVCV